MKTSFRLIFTLTLIIFTSMIANAGDREAMTAAKEWLALVDAGEYNQSWLTANKTLKEQSEKDDWANYLKAIREPLGKIISRKVTRTRTVTQIQGMPDGGYFQVQFVSNRAAARSTIHSNCPGSGRINWAGKRSG